jgi:hypothetical protein
MELAGRVVVQSVLAEFTARWHRGGRKRCEKQMRSWRTVLGMVIEGQVAAVGLDIQSAQEALKDADRHCKACGKCSFGR